MIPDRLTLLLLQTLSLWEYLATGGIVTDTQAETFAAMEAEYLRLRRVLDPLRDTIGWSCIYPGYTPDEFDREVAAEKLKGIREALDAWRTP